VEMRGAVFSSEGEVEDGGSGVGFSGAGELIWSSGSWAWAVGFGLETK
jgi:hypothetical protein